MGLIRSYEDSVCAGAERGRTGARVVVVEVKEGYRGTSRERPWAGLRVVSRPHELNNCLISSSQKRVLAREFRAGIVLIYTIVVSFHTINKRRDQLYPVIYAVGHPVRGLLDRKISE